MFQATISSEELAALPRGAFGGEIVIVENEKQATQACKYLAKHSIIGFDTETRPSFKAGVTYPLALLQLATAERAFLFRLSKMPLCKSIIKILEDKHITKVGVATRDDIKGLNKLHKFKANGFLDLQSIVGKYGITELSLRKMAGIVLEINVSKAQRLSNWEAVTYTEAQSLYAATDAWVCCEIYKKLNPPSLNTASKTERLGSKGNLSEKT